MSTNWMNDMYNMHRDFGIHTAVQKMNKETLKKFLEFRIKSQIKEEYQELEAAFDSGDPEEIVDALIDLTVFAIGTLDLFDINGYSAWSKVYLANKSKKPGIKEGRPNPFGLPDLVKPEGWLPPSHKGNHGLMADLFEEE